MLKKYYGKSGNLTNARDNQGISGKLFIFVSSINRNPGMLGKSVQENNFYP